MTALLSRAFLYDQVLQPWFEPGEVARYLRGALPHLAVEVRGPLLAPAEGLPERLCRIRAFDPRRPVGQAVRKPLKPELEYERRLLEGTLAATPGVVYDGNDLQRLACRFLARDERSEDAVHIWFTRRLFATWDETDGRYHARAALYGLPSLVSVAGMVEAPARERAWYLARRLGAQPNEDPRRHLVHQDPRTTEVAKGYALQAILYVATGEPFCDDPACRLYNAHWQEELLRSQLGGKLCPRHQGILAELANVGSEVR